MIWCECVSGNDFSFFCTLEDGDSNAVPRQCYKPAPIDRLQYINPIRLSAVKKKRRECLIERCQCLTDAQYIRLKSRLRHSPLSSSSSTSFNGGIELIRHLKFDLFWLPRRFVNSRFMINFVGAQEDYALLGTREPHATGMPLLIARVLRNIDWVKFMWLRARVGSECWEFQIRNKRIINGFAHRHYYPILKSLIPKNRLINHSHMRWSHCTKYGIYVCFVFASFALNGVCLDFTIQYSVPFFAFLLIAAVHRYVTGRNISDTTFKNTPRLDADWGVFHFMTIATTVCGGGFFL